MCCVVVLTYIYLAKTPPTKQNVVKTPQTKNTPPKIVLTGINDPPTNAFNKVFVSDFSSVRQVPFKPTFANPSKPVTTTPQVTTDASKQPPKAKPTPTPDPPTPTSTPSATGSTQNPPQTFSTANPFGIWPPSSNPPTPNVPDRNTFSADPEVTRIIRMLASENNELRKEVKRLEQISNHWQFKACKAATFLEAAKKEVEQKDVLAKQLL